MKLLKLLAVFVFLSSGHIYANKINLVHKDTWGDKSYGMMISEGDTLYVATDGVLVLDTSDPNQLTKTAKIPINSFDRIIKFDKIGDVLYVLTNKRFFVIDIQNLQDSPTVATIDYPGANGWVDFVIKNKQLFLVGQDIPHLYAYDIATASSPLLIQSIILDESTTNGIKVALTSSDLVVGINEQIKLLSLDNASFLTEMLSDTQQFTADVIELQSIGDVVYFVDTGSIIIYDFSIPASVTKSTIEVTTGWISDIKLDVGNNLRILDNSGFIYIYSANDTPTTPVFVTKTTSRFPGSFIEPSEALTFISDFFRGIIVTNNLSEVSTYNQAEVYTDLSVNGGLLASANFNEIQFFEMNNGEFPTPITSSITASAAELNETLLYTSNQTIYDVSDLNNLIQVGSFQHDIKGQEIVQLSITDGELHSRNSAIVTNFTLSAATNPDQKNAVETSTATSGASSQSTALASVNGNFYLGTTSGLFHFFEDENQDLIIGDNLITSSHIYAEEIVGNYLYVLSSSILSIFDITDSNKPILVDSIETASLGNGDIKSYKNWLFVDARLEGISIYDISTPEAPLLISNQLSSIVPRIRHDVVTLDNNLLYATSGQIISIQINEAPTILTSSFTVDEDNVLVEVLSVENLENDDLTYQITTNTTNGAATIDQTGSVNYQPNADFNGNDSFTVNVVDEFGGNNEKTITITVNPIDDLPVVQVNSFDTLEDTILQDSLSATDVDGDTLTYTLTEQTSSGLVTLNTDGSFEFLPNTNFSGEDSFDFSVSDEISDIDGTITINVLPVNDTPVVEDASFIVDEDILLSDQLTAFDAESQALIFILVTAPVNGSLTLNQDGSFEYSPNENFNGADSFEVKANDGTENGDGDPKVVNLTVNSINDAPTTQNQSENVVSGEALTGTLSSSDIDDDTLTYSLDTSTTNGTISLSSNGSFTYTSNPEFSGNDSFTFVVSDPAGGTATGSVSINVTQAPTSNSGGSISWMLVLMLLISSRTRRGESTSSHS